MNWSPRDRHLNRLESPHLAGSRLATLAVRAYRGLATLGHAVAVAEQDILAPLG